MDIFVCIYLYIRIYLYIYRKLLCVPFYGTVIGGKAYNYADDQTIYLHIYWKRNFKKPGAIIQTRSLWPCKEPLCAAWSDGKRHP